MDESRFEQNFNRLKILAPVNSLKMADTVIKNGADIIYAGIRGWSLRPDIFEITREEMEEIIQLAKTKQKEVYLAMNCFYRSVEIPEAMKIIGDFHARGINGVILSEIGLMHLVRNKFPDLEINVSVQTSASNSMEIEFYEKLGINAVVLPRNLVDLSDENIRAMAGRKVALEVFAIGDDSTNYDGRCLLSAYFHQQVIPDSTTGRQEMILGSANRCGYCYLVCKRKCTIGGKSGYHLRRGDLYLHRRIPELVKAGIRIFKVQGREFPLPLVGELIRSFRGLLDNYQDPQKSAKYISQLDDLIKLKQIIAGNHLWLLAKSKSPLWKRLRRYIEHPWDTLTVTLWLGNYWARKLMKRIYNARGFFNE